MEMHGCLDCKFYVSWEWHNEKCSFNQTKIFNPLKGKNVGDPFLHDNCYDKNHDGNCEDFEKAFLLIRILNNFCGG